MDKKKNTQQNYTSDDNVSLLFDFVQLGFIFGG